MESEAAPVGGKRSAWLSHVKKTMKANKGKSLKAVLKLASKSFKKTAKRRGGALSPLPLTGGRSRGTRKSRKGGKYY